MCVSVMTVLDADDAEACQLQTLVLADGVTMTTRETDKLIATVAAS